MILFGVNFSLYYLILCGKIKSALKSTELRTYLGIILFSTLIIAFNCRHLFGSLGETLRHSVFQVGSIITTTGYATTDFNMWPQFSKTILMLLMFCGACTGSTGGGIKVSRITLLAKSIVKEIKVLTHPKSMVKVKYNGKVLEHETLRGINVFFVSYMIIYAFVFLIISLDNFDFTTTITAVVATLSNIGPGFSLVGPMGNFSIFSPLSKIVLTFAMIVGRLEIFPMIVLLSRKTWKR
jgi:trk system potassium uptake protein TrkH